MYRQSKAAHESPGSSICRILKEERNYILQMIKKIRASGANVLLIQKSILRDAVTDLSLHYLVGHLRNMPMSLAFLAAHRALCVLASIWVLSGLLACCDSGYVLASKICFHACQLDFWSRKL